MVLPVSHQALQHVRTAQHGTVRGCGTADSDMVTAASTSMATIEHKFFCCQPCQPGFLIDCPGIRQQLIPAMRGMNIHLDDTGVRGDCETFQAMIMRRFIAFHTHRHIQFSCRFFDRVHQIKIMFQVGQRWQEYVQMTITRLDTYRGMYQFCILLIILIEMLLIESFRVYRLFFCPRISSRNLTIDIAQLRSRFKAAGPLYL